MKKLIFIFTTIAIWVVGCGVGKRMQLQSTPPSPVGEEMKNVSYKRDLFPLFQSACGNCHNATSPASQPNWMDYQTAAAKRNQIYDRVWVKRDMPPGGGLSQTGRRMIAEWAKSGAPETVAAPMTSAPAGAPEAKMVMSRGEYLARASNCITCHTTTSKSSDVGAGGRRIETPFGVLVTPNITPDNDTGIGRWSAEDFYRALHDGIGKDGEYLFPAMPYTFFTRLTREDVMAIYSYLKTLQPVYREIEPNQLKVPFNIRPLQAFWRKLYFTPGTFEPDLSKSAEWNRGAYLVKGAAHCEACHSPRNFMGGIEKGKTFLGGTVDNWYAPSLKASGDNYELNRWTTDELVQFFKTGSVHGKVVLGPMAEVIYDGLQYLENADLKSIATYIKWLSTDANEEQYVHERSHRLYSENCAQCHGAEGKGKPGVYPAFVNNQSLKIQDPSNLINVVILGIPPQGKYGEMPAFGDKLNDQEVADILNYLRSNWGDKSLPLVTREEVAKQRRALK